MNQPKIFISHSHTDREAAIKIADAIKKAGLDVWIDDALLPGQNWIAEIDKALSEAGFLLALVSTASVQSVWVQQEWTAMLTRQLSGTGGGVVIPLRLENVKPPLLLQTLQRIDLFPDFQAGVDKLVGFLLSETQPAVLVQEELKNGGSVSELTPESFKPARMARPSAHFSTRTWNAWHAVMERRDRLTEEVLQKLDKSS